MRGEPFFNCQIGFVGCQAFCLKGIMGVKDFEENKNRSESVSIIYILLDHTHANMLESLETVLEICKRS